MKNYPHLPNSDKVLFSEINIAYQTNGNKPWHSHYHYPQVGVSLFYNDLGNKEAFGQNFCVLPNFTFRHGNTAKFFGEIRLGFGLAFFNKKYNIVENPSNLYVGSAITNVSFASYDIARFISSRVALKAGLSVFHFSNGHYQLPNIGMNIPGFNIGVKYYPYKMPEKFLDKRIEGYDDKIRFTARFGFGWHEFGYSTFPTGGPKYPVYMGTFYVSKRFTAVNNVKLGLFVNYYTSFYDFIVSQEIFKEYQHLKSSVVSVFLGHEFIIGKFGLVAEAGINVFNPFRRKFTRLYSDSVDFTTFLKTLSGNKLGVQYYPFSPEKSTKHKLYIGAYIKANLGQADFVEYGIGYTF
ncbi:MAG: acyloxyacyl hydrolase [Bacteroidia bacterium]|nr:acyloxyacyl hydrolase [Bacteroidia bacterium]